MQYMAARPKKWFVTVIGILIGVIFIEDTISFFMQPDHYDVEQSNYVEKLLEDVYGPQTRILEDLQTKEIFLPALEVGKREPYFFSRGLTNDDMEKYNFNTSDMMRATFQYPGVLM